MMRYLWQREPRCGTQKSQLQNLYNMLPEIARQRRVYLVTRWMSAKTKHNKAGLILVGYPLRQILSFPITGMKEKSLLVAINGLYALPSTL